MRMPSLNEHVRRSVKRTGQAYAELNLWLDGDTASLLERLQRHFQIKKYSKYVQSKWGEKGLQEYRNHLSDDFRLFPTNWMLILREKLVQQLTRKNDGGKVRDE